MNKSDEKIVLSNEDNEKLNPDVNTSEVKRFMNNSYSSSESSMSSSSEDNIAYQ